MTGCECERSSNATLAQVLLMANSNEIENKLASGQGKIAALLKANKPIDDIVEELYLGGYSRLPQPRERQATASYVAGQENKQKALEDVLWTIINSKEFMFNH